MTAPTREQVLEWVKSAEVPINRPVQFQEFARLCALAYAAGKAEGAREENEACEKLCLTPFPESGTPHSLAFDSPEECADAIRKRRPA